MATQIEKFDVGVDVCKDWLDIATENDVVRIENTTKAIKAFVRSLPTLARLAIEPTQRYHERLLQVAKAAGHTVYLVDAYRVSRYREAIGQRVKNDVCDARLLLHYVQTQGATLKPYEMPPKAVIKLRELLHARAKLTDAKVTIGQALHEVGELSQTSKALVSRMQEAIALIDRKLTRCIKESGYQADAKRCEAIPGIGKLTGAGLVMTFHRGSFTSADAFVAYMGLDLRVRESGCFRGRRKLSKRGDPELRRLLFNAARAGARTAQWSDYYLRLRARGLSTTAAYVALSRKLARVAFALFKNQSDFVGKIAM